MIVRPATEPDFEAWAAMRRRLWPDAEETAAELASRVGRDPPLAVFLAMSDEGYATGFAEASVRSVAEGGPDGPAAYLEGIWVEPGQRRRGVARALLESVESWARARGLAHLGSDALFDNEVSHAWHCQVGFAEVERLVVFGKALR